MFPVYRKTKLSSTRSAHVKRYGQGEPSENAYIERIVRVR